MSTPHTGTGASASLPELTAARVDEIEDALFADISRERSRETARRHRRGRIWIAGGAAAAVVAIAAIIAPSVGDIVSGTGGFDGSAVAPVPGVAEDSGVTFDSPVQLDSRESATLTEGGGSDVIAPAGRDIITTASATITVDDVEASARAIADAAVAHGGYVESMSVGTDGTVIPIDPMTGAVVDDGAVVYDTMPVPYNPNGAWVTVRVPAGDLSSVIDELGDIGDVTATSINRQDVTEQTIDLEARIAAAQASVDRLTELMGQAQNVADLIAAESALSERQALLESYQQQLEMLEGQVAMSTLSVTVLPDVEPVTADPAGFTDGLAAGWNGLVATLNGIVVALGFLLPWLVVVAVAALVVWAIVRLVRARRRRRADAAPRPPASVDRVDTTE